MHELFWVSLKGMAWVRAGRTVPWGVLGRRRQVGTVRRTIFRNTQWEVTNFGISSRMSAAPCRYDIDAESLLATERFGEKGLYAWPLHVARMAWVTRVCSLKASRQL
jgi:hypothetical protein